jgi:hypothetical protein
MKKLSIYLIGFILLVFCYCMAGCEAQGKMTETKLKTTCAGGYCINTIEHDGHLYVFLYQGGILHHPDCVKSDSLKAKQN